MVWAIRSASGFGDFFPDGSYGDYYDSIIEYFQNNMIDSERAKFNDMPLDYSSFVLEKFLDDTEFLQEHEWPDEFKTTKSHNNLGSLIKTENRILAVDQGLKNTIEKLEPDLHQFSPIKITMPKGKEYPKQYYAMVISQFHDSFSPEDSDEGSWEDMSFDAYWGERIKSFNVSIPKKQNYNGLALKKNTFGASHLWRERSLKDPDIYLSDELVSEIKRQNLRTPAIYQLKEV